MQKNTKSKQVLLMNSLSLSRTEQTVMIQTTMYCVVISLLKYENWYKKEKEKNQLF